MKNTTLLSSSISLAAPSPRPGLRLPSLSVTTATLLLLFSTASSAFAGSATWRMNPVNGDWNHAANWTPPTIPNGPSDMATFATSNRTAVSLSANTEVNGIVFNAGASAFTITSGPGFQLTISGVGITNNSGITQNFVAAGDPSTGNPGVIQFFNSATAGSFNSATAGSFNSDTAGSSTSFTLNGWGIIYFYNASTAGTGTFTLNGDPTTGNTSFIQFYDSSTAANGSFTLNLASIQFFRTSTAGTGTFTLNGDPTTGNTSAMAFYESSSAGAGTFTLNAPTLLYFTHASTAGAGTFTLNTDPVNDYASFMVFTDSSSAGTGTFTLNGGTLSGGGGSFIIITSGATAGNGTFTINGPGVSDANGSYMEIDSGATAGNGTFTINGAEVSGAFAAALVIYGNADAATLIANAGVGRGAYGGRIILFDDSLGGTSRVEVFGNGTGDLTDGNLDISVHYAPGVTIGSIEGSGTVFLGANKLTVGANNLSTKFSGIITDGFGTGGSLTKIGRGKLVLHHRNTYTGGTTIKRGKLMVNNIGGSGTGSGPVQVNGGTLGGKGIIAGAVTVGTGSGQAATLSPGYVHGVGSPGALTIQSALTFNSDATYDVDVNSSIATADEVIANGVTINSGAQFSFADIRSGALPIGTAFTIIDNASATPIAGTFSNLPDGSMFTVNGNTYQVNYEGRDGNDLTLTVVP
jgi:autotransporter-associated beta strand protein